MADLKFKECENRRSIDEISSGEFTDYMFMMYRKGEDGWYKNTIQPHCEFRYGPSVSAALCGACIRKSIRITQDKDGKAAFFSADKVISELNECGRSLGLAEVDGVYASYALRELVKLERQFLSENSFLVAHLSLFSNDKKVTYPAGTCTFTVMLEYREVSDATVSAMTLPLECTALLPESAHFRARAAAEMTGYDDVLWLDPVYKKYVQGLGLMSVFFRLENEIITPCGGKDMMTRTACSLMKTWGLTVTERKISTDELMQLYSKGEVLEVFCVSDTEAVRSCTVLDIQDTVMEFGTGKLTKKLISSIANIEKGLLVSKTAFERI
ncbi:MAG: hypothetical protein IJ408_06140 [Clostridia bacterium]|nr:hypothetical protein [Clostridia bacterium]